MNVCLTIAQLGYVAPQMNECLTIAQLGYVAPQMNECLTIAQLGYVAPQMNECLTIAQMSYLLQNCFLHIPPIYTWHIINKKIIKNLPLIHNTCVELFQVNLLSV